MLWMAELKSSNPGHSERLQFNNLIKNKMKPIRHLISIVFLLCGLAAQGSEKVYDHSDMVGTYKCEIQEYTLDLHLHTDNTFMVVDNDTYRRFGKWEDQEDLVVHGQLLRAHVQAVEEAGGLHLLGLLDVLLGQAALLGSHEDEFLIVERNAQFLGQLLANGPAAGTVFTGNGDDRDLVHRILLL